MYIEPEHLSLIVVYIKPFYFKWQHQFQCFSLKMLKFELSALLKFYFKRTVFYLFFQNLFFVYFPTTEKSHVSAECCIGSLRSKKTQRSQWRTTKSRWVSSCWLFVWKKRFLLIKMSNIPNAFFLFKRRRCKSRGKCFSIFYSNFKKCFSEINDLFWSLLPHAAARNFEWKQPEESEEFDLVLLTFYYFLSYFCF